MSEAVPMVYLVRHGETTWSLTGQHTGLTDLPLTPRGAPNARSLAERLRGLSFASAVTSPLQRAARTSDLAGFGAVAEVDRDLVDWDYGQEGLRSTEILADRPDWELFRDGCPGGESPEQVAARADRVIERISCHHGRHPAVFQRALQSCHSRPLAGVGTGLGGLSTANLSALSYEHRFAHPVIRLWNDDHHVAA